MKVLTLILTLVALAVIIAVVAGVFFFRNYRKMRCGNCEFCDHVLDHCWMRGITVGREDKACVTFRKREYETEK